MQSLIVFKNSSESSMRALRSQFKRVGQTLFYLAPERLRLASTVTKPLIRARFST